MVSLRCLFAKDCAYCIDRNEAQGSCLLTITLHFGVKRHHELQIQEWPAEHFTKKEELSWFFVHRYTLCQPALRQISVHQLFATCTNQATTKSQLEDKRERERMRDKVGEGGTEKGRAIACSSENRTRAHLSRG